MVGRQRRLELRERRTGRQPGFVEPLDERRLGHGDQLRRRRNFGQQRQQVFVLPPRRGIELVVAVDVGLHDRRLDPLRRLLPARIDRKRHGRRHDDGQRRTHPVPHAAPMQPRLEKEQVADQHPQRTAEDTRIFVPLHGPCVVRETVAQQQPRKREFAHGVPIFGSDPARDQQRVGQRLVRPLAHRMEQHEGQHIEEGRDERRGERTDGRRIPQAPDRRAVPEDEGQPCPAEHPPPVAARRPVTAADPQQGHQRYDERKAGQSEPPRRKQRRGEEHA